MNIQKIVDRVFERRTVDKFIPVTQYEYKQREGRHMLDTAQLNDEVNKLREALIANDIEVAEQATDEEIITAMLTEEENFQHQQKVNTYNERVTRYKEGSLVERVRIMFEGAPQKPLKNPVLKEEDYDEKQSYADFKTEVDATDEPEELSEEDAEEIRDILSNVSEEQLEKLDKKGSKEEAIQLADEVMRRLQGEPQKPVLG